MNKNYKRHAQQRVFVFQNGIEEQEGDDLQLLIDDGWRVIRADSPRDDDLIVYILEKHNL